MQSLFDFLVRKNRDALWVVLVCVIAFFPLFTDKTLVYGDNFSLMVPGKLYSAHWLSNGILSLWNPTLFGGIPWLADINQSVLYPSTLLFVWLEPALALNALLIFHVVFTGLGMVFLGRSLQITSAGRALLATLWMLSPQLIGSMNNIATIQSLSYMPWVVWAGLRLDRPWGALAFAGLVTLQFLGGYPQHVLYSIATAFLVWFGVTWQQNRKIPRYLAIMYVWRWLYAGVLVLGVSAMAWLPFISILEETTRSIQSSAQAASGSLHPLEMLKLIVPTIFDHLQWGMKWSVSWSKPPNVMLFFGWFSLFLGVLIVVSRQLKKQAVVYLGASLLAVIIALGDATPLFQLWQTIPFIGSSRGMSTILIIPALLGCIVVAQWFDQLQVNVRRAAGIFLSHSSRWWNWLNALVLIIFVCSLGMWLVVLHAFPLVWSFADQSLGYALSSSTFHTLERSQIIARVLTFSIAFLSLGFILSVNNYLKGRYWFVVALVGIELAAFTSQHLFFAPAEVYNQYERQTSNLTQQIIDKTGNNYRILSRNYNTPYTDFGAYWEAIAVRAPFSDSYVDAQELEHFTQLKRMQSVLTPNWNMTNNIPTINGFTTLLPTTMQQIFSSPKNEAAINNLPPISTSHPALSEWAVGYYLVDTWFPEYAEEFPDHIVTETPFWKLYKIEGALPRFRTVADNAVTFIDSTKAQIGYPLGWCCRMILAC